MPEHTHALAMRTALNGLTLASSSLACIADGMDQAKFKVPRVKTRYSKVFTTLWRPRLHMSGTWMHGSHIAFSVADADVKKNSDCQIECISRELERLLLLHDALPAGLTVQQDNTAREGKNRFFMAWMILCVSLGIFRYTIANFLRKGHSTLFFNSFFFSIRFWASPFGFQAAFGTKVMKI